MNRKTFVKVVGMSGIAASAAPGAFLASWDDVAQSGHWPGPTIDVALARKSVDGWTSIYAGTAPLPVHLLRWFASEAGAQLWSSQPDVVTASEDVAALVATSAGVRTFRPHKPLKRDGSSDSSSEHRIECEFGDVTLSAK